MVCRNRSNRCGCGCRKICGCGGRRNNLGSVFGTSANRGWNMPVREFDSFDNGVGIRSNRRHRECGCGR